MPWFPGLAGTARQLNLTFSDKGGSSTSRPGVTLLWQVQCQSEYLQVQCQSELSKSPHLDSFQSFEHLIDVAELRLKTFMLKQPLLPWASQDIFNVKVKAFFTHTRQGPHPSLKEFMCLFEFICYPTIFHEKCTLACRTCQYIEFLLERNLSHPRRSSVNSSSLIIFKIGIADPLSGIPGWF